MNDLYIYLVVGALLVLYIAYTVILIYKTAKKIQKIQKIQNEGVLGTLVDVRDTLVQITTIQKKTLELVRQKRHEEVLEIHANLLEEIKNNYEESCDEIATLSSDVETFKEVIRAQQLETKELIDNHLKNVEKVVTACVPYMADKALTGENIQQAVAEQDAEFEDNLNASVAQLNNLMGVG